MYVTVLGMSTEANPPQSLKASSPIWVTPSGISMDVRQEHLPNAYFPILVTPSGMLKDARLEQPEYLQLIVYQYISIKTVEK